MRCDFCRKKTSVPHKCNYCVGSYCPSCTQLEIHCCKGLETKQQKELNNLKEKLVHVVAPKHTFV